MVDPEEKDENGVSNHIPETLAEEQDEIDDETENVDPEEKDENGASNHIPETLAEEQDEIDEATENVIDGTGALVDDLSADLSRSNEEVLEEYPGEGEIYREEQKGLGSHYEAADLPESFQDFESSETQYEGEYESTESRDYIVGNDGGEYMPSERSEEVEVEEDDEKPSSASSMSQVYSKLSPFFIKWAFGIKASTKLINLTKNKQFEVFYASSHFGVLYDYRRNSMSFLPGHNSSVSSIAADRSGRWLVTADDGNDNVIIIWDHDRRVPCWSLYNIFSGAGIRCVQISQDARFLAAVSNDKKQTCSFFLWTRGREQADGSIELGSNNGTVTNIQFNHLDTTQFAITMEMAVMFCKWDPDKNILEQSLSEVKKHKNKVGTFRETLFLDDNHSAITSTNSGQIVVWCDVLHPDSVQKETPGNIRKNFLKTIKIHKSGITSIRLTDEAVVSSSEEGVISFHDQTLRLLYWVPKYQFEPVVCVSCNLHQMRQDQMDPFSDDFDDVLLSKRSTSEENIQDLVRDDDWEDGGGGSVYSGSDEETTVSSKVLEFAEDSGKEVKATVPSDCTIEKRPFYMRDFIFLTWKGRFGYVSHHRTKVRYFLNKYEAPILSMDCNPNISHLAFGNSKGRVVLYEYTHKKVLVSNDVAGTGIMTLSYSPTGRYLMAGLSNGLVMVLDPMILTVKQKFHIGTSEIGKVCFTSNEKIFAFYDKENIVYVHKLMKYEKTKVKRWVFMGGYKSHFKPINDIMFDEKYDDDQKDKVPRLFTIGQDRMLVEYDIKSMQPGILKLKSIDRIEQTAIPQCFAILPKYKNKFCFLVANNEYKFKVIERDTRVCAETTLGPTADSPLTFMKVLPGSTNTTHSAKMIYSTEKHIGLRLLPATGNPFEGMGIVANPVKVTSIAISHDFKYVFTTGSSDCSLLMWKVNSRSVEIAHQLGGTGLEPYMSLIEGGSNGFLFKEIQDMFYYAQIVHQGEHANTERSVTKTLAFCEIPDLVRSLGYYPTDYEIANIMYEVNNSQSEETGGPKTEISFEECVKIYLNHRPVNGISFESINRALLSVADLSDPECVILEKEELYKSLEERAEAMSHAEVLGYLCILLLPKNEKDPIPSTMTLKEFADDVLGIDLTITEENVREVTHPTDNKNAL